MTLHFGIFLSEVFSTLIKALKIELLGDLVWFHVATLLTNGF